LEGFNYILFAKALKEVLNCRCRLSALQFIVFYCAVRLSDYPNLTPLQLSAGAVTNKW